MGLAKILWRLSNQNINLELEVGWSVVSIAKVAEVGKVQMVGAGLRASKNARHKPESEEEWDLSQDYYQGSRMKVWRYRKEIGLNTEVVQMTKM